MILVEDASPDNSWNVCKKLAIKYPRVRVYQHPDRKNHGAGATRNLGILKSRYEYISFLDADDYFLSYRFTYAKDLFATDPDLDGVYEPIGINFEDAFSQERWVKANRSIDELFMIKEMVPPEELFKGMILGRLGYFHLDGFVFKRRILERIGLMNEDLRLHQDTLFILQTAALSRLKPGATDKPVAIRRVHNHNRISAPRSPKKIYRDRLQLLKKLWKWSKGNLSVEEQYLVQNKIIHYGLSLYRFDNVQNGYRVKKLFAWGLLLLECPELIFDRFFCHIPFQLIFQEG